MSLPVDRKPIGTPRAGGLPRPPARPRWVTLRALLVALPFIPFMAYWAASRNLDVILALAFPPVGTILILLILNLPLRRWAPRWALGEGELVVIFAMLSLACALSAEWMDNVFPLIYSYALFNDPNNRFSVLVTPYVSDRFFIKDRRALPGFLEGGHSLGYMLLHLRPWEAPFAWWTLFLGLLVLCMVCICSLFRREWTEREKLAFPVIQLPIALTAGGGDSPFWRSRLMWGTCAVMFAVDMMNGFAYLYPSVPRINVRFLGDVSVAFHDPPWNAIGWTPIGLFPFITAMATFLPSDLLFSAIFFFFFRKGQQVVAAALGYEQGLFGGGWLVPSPPYFSEQSWGAFLGLFLVAIWIARHYLREVWVSIRTGEPVTGREMVPHRWAFAGLLAGVAGLCAISRSIGLSVPFALFYIALYLAFSVVVARMRAELGPPTHEMAFMGPNQLIVDFAGTGGVPSAYVPNLATQFHFMNRIHRTDPMPNALEGAKMAERSNVIYAGFFAALLVAAVLAIISAFGVRLYQGYRWGAVRAGDDTAAVVSDLLTNPRGPNGAAMAFVFLGMAMVLGLNKLRYAFPSFPLNPVGYALGMNFGVDFYWFGLLAAFLVKGAVQRYGGLRAYRRLHTFALGVMVGEYAAETIWAIYGMVTHTATYTVSINWMQ